MFPIACKEPFRSSHTDCPDEDDAQKAKAYRKCTDGVHTAINPSSQRLLAASLAEAKAPKAKKKPGPKAKGKAKAKAKAKAKGKAAPKPKEKAKPKSSPKAKAKAKEEDGARTPYAAAKGAFLQKLLG